MELILSRACPQGTLGGAKLDQHGAILRIRKGPGGAGYSVQL